MGKSLLLSTTCAKLVCASTFSGRALTFFYTAANNFIRPWRRLRCTVTLLSILLQSQA